MLKRIEPIKIICYGEPFEEMKGKIISVDYAETNSLKTYFKKTGQQSRAVTVKGEPVCLIKGGGAAGGGGGRSLPVRYKPNGKKSLHKDGKLIRERFYDEDGKASKDIDYDDHGHPKQHPDVPHEHEWDWSNPTDPRGPGQPLTD